MADQGLGCDWVGIDFDIDGTGTAQYNYVHDNAGACILSYGNTFRYNMCENNDALHKSGGEISIVPNSLVSVYNNTMFESGQDPTNTEPSCFFFGYNGATAPGSVFKNNLCVLTRLNSSGNNNYVRGFTTTQTGVQMTNNLWFGGTNAWVLSPALVCRPRS